MRIAYRHVEFYALRDIEAGEELTAHYGETHHEGTLPCRCGADRCQGFI
jgi:SET domain-containing protein